jgi:hypothetical protein
MVVFRIVRPTVWVKGGGRVGSAATGTLAVSHSGRASTSGSTPVSTPGSAPGSASGREFSALLVVRLSGCRPASATAIGTRVVVDVCGLVLASSRASARATAVLVPPGCGVVLTVSGPGPGPSLCTRTSTTPGERNVAWRIGLKV